jgi:TRAP-type C4-dicarboxylate transport system permease small subunit
MGLLVVFGAVMSVIVMLQIFFRFVIDVPSPWSEELARYLMIWTGMVGSFVAMRIPMFFPFIAVPVGAALMIIELAAGILNEIHPIEPGVRRKISAATLDG